MTGICCLVPTVSKDLKSCLNGGCLVPSRLIYTLYLGPNIVHLSTFFPLPMSHVRPSILTPVGITHMNELVANNVLVWIGLCFTLDAEHWLGWRWSCWRSSLCHRSWQGRTCLNSRFQWHTTRRSLASYCRTHELLSQSMGCWYSRHSSPHP